MKTLIRYNIASVLCLAMLAACAPAKRTSSRTVKPDGTNNALTQTVPGLPPLQGDVTSAEVLLPVNPADAGLINLETSKSGTLSISISPTSDPTSGGFVTVSKNPKITTSAFSCVTPQGAATLNLCTDAVGTVTVTGPDNKPAQLNIEFSRRAEVPVVRQVLLPNAAQPEESAPFGTAYYARTNLQDSSNTPNGKHTFEVALITATTAKETDVSVATKKLSEGTKNEVRFEVKGDLGSDKAGNVLKPVAANAADRSISLFDKDTGALVKNFNVASADGTTVKVVKLLVMKNKADGTLDGTLDITKMPNVVTASGSADAFKKTDDASKTAAADDAAKKAVADEATKKAAEDAAKKAGITTDAAKKAADDAAKKAAADDAAKKAADDAAKKAAADDAAKKAADDAAKKAAADDAAKKAADDASNKSGPTGEQQLTTDGKGTPAASMTTAMKNWFAAHIMVPALTAMHTIM